MITRLITSLIQKEMENDKVIVVTGMRRVGKTTLIEHLYHNVTKKRKLYLDLENTLNQRYFAEIDYDKIKIIFDQLAIGREKEMIVFLDEAQNVKNLPSVVKYLADHYHIKFVLTGSASFYLKNLFSESLAGRKRLFEMFPLHFSEFLSYKNPSLKKPQIGDEISKNLYHIFEKYYSEYILYGGFPGVVVKDTHEEKMKELNDIFTSYFQNEIRLLSDFRKLEVVRSLILLIATRVGAKIDVSKISSELGISRITAEEYLSFLEGTYFLSRAKSFSNNLDVSLRAHSRPYLTDVGFLTQIGNVPLSVNLANSVYNLLQHAGEVFYYQNKSGTEIDFVVKSKEKTTAFEVKTFADKNDVQRLKRLSKKLDIKEYFVVSQKFCAVQNVIYPFQL